MDYAGQLAFKEKKVHDCLIRIGGVDMDKMECLPIHGIHADVCGGLDGCDGSDGCGGCGDGATGSCGGVGGVSSQAGLSQSQVPQRSDSPKIIGIPI